MTTDTSGKSYELEPPDDDAGGGEPLPGEGETARLEQPGDSQPLEVEPAAGEPGDLPPDPVEAEAEAVGPAGTIEVCPNCGAALPGDETLICLRCGFNLKTLKVIQTATGETSESEEAEVEAPAISGPGQGGLLLPQIMAAASALVISVGYLSGAEGLFIDDMFIDDMSPGFGRRVVGLVGGMLLIALWSAAGLGGLGFLARFVVLRKLGDLRLAAVRMLAITATMRLLSFIDPPQEPLSLKWLELLLEYIGQAAVFVGLAMYFYVLNVRNALITGIAAILMVLVLLAVSAASLGILLPG